VFARCIALRPDMQFASQAESRGRKEGRCRCTVAHQGRQGRVVLAMEGTMLVEQLAESTPPKEQLGARTVPGSCPPGGGRDACAASNSIRNLVAASARPAPLAITQQHRASRSWYLAAIKPHRRALPRTGSSREGDCRSPH
jgi:hypothetical protein